MAILLSSVFCSSKSTAFTPCVDAGAAYLGRRVVGAFGSHRDMARYGTVAEGLWSWARFTRASVAVTEGVRCDDCLVLVAVADRRHYAACREEDTENERVQGTR